MNTIFRTEWKQAIASLPAEIRCEVYEAAIEYCNGGDVSNISQMAQVAFGFIKSALEHDIAEYEKICRRNRENGAKGGRKRKQSNPVGFSETQSNPVGFSETQSPLNSNLNSNLNSISSVEDSSICVRSAPQQKRFIKPTINEIQDYINAQMYDVDAERFWNYYESNGWKVGRNQMKDWRAAVRTWSRSESKSLTNKQKDNGTNQRIDPRRIAAAAFAMADAAAERDRIFDARH